MRKSPEKIKDIIGKTYNYLTIINEAKSIDKISKEGWKYKITILNCKCVCGNFKEVRMSNLKNGGIKSCGCKRRQLINKGIDIAYKKKYTNPVELKLHTAYKQDAKRSNRLFEIELENFTKLINSNCHYCGIEPYLIRSNKTKSVTKALNGVDRIDSKKGYIEGNVVACCPTCNRAKMAMSLKEFKNWINRIYNHINNKEIFQA